MVECGWLPPLTFPVNTSLIPSIGHNEVIGVCRVGPEAADPHGREHWAEMLANPRKPVEHWHQLVEVSGGHLCRAWALGVLCGLGQVTQPLCSSAVFSPWTSACG